LGGIEMTKRIEKGENMDSNRKTAIFVGVLFITATVAYSLGVIFLDPILGGSDYLTKASENEKQVILGALLVLIDAVAVAGIAIMRYPILKKHNETLALGYVGARIVESVLFFVNVIFILTLLTLSQEFVKAGASDASYYQTLGTLLLSAGNWAYLLGLGLAFALSALMLNSLLYQSKLIPRWLSGWGLVGAALVFANYLLESFSINPVEILFLPIAVQEMVFAVWLIIKGFNSSATASGSAKIELNEIK
jgi:uncharacterized membrane protein